MKPHSFFAPANIFKILKQCNKTLIFFAYNNAEF